MTSYFNAKKAVQAAGVLLRAHGKRMSHLRLLKLLYIAERKSIKDDGCPLVGGHFVAMNHGPLHDDVYQLIKGEHRRYSIWAGHVARVGQHDIVLERDTGVDELSEYEIRLLNTISEENEHLDDFTLAEFTHEFEEWRAAWEAREGRKANRISLESVVNASRDESDRSAVIQALKERALFDGLHATRTAE
jgi:uncharacterized phage-associated protein